MKIALTGGIACGKSTLAKFLRELGICLLDADDVVHELEGVGGAAVPAIVSEFGPEILALDGSIDRPKLAARVFTPPGGQSPSSPPPGGQSPNASPRGQSPEEADQRTRLEAILFPLVRARLLDFVSNSGTVPQSTGTVPSTTVPTPTPAGTVPQFTGTVPTPTMGTVPSTSPLRIAIIPLLFESHWDSDYDIIIAITSPEDQQIDRMMHTRHYTRAQAEARLTAQMPVAEKAARADFVVVNDSTPEHLREEARQLVAWLKERVVDER